MTRLPAPPPRDPDDDARKGRLLRSLVTAMAAMSTFGLITSLINPSADDLTTVSFYGPIFAWLGLLAWLVKRGKVVFAGFFTAAFFWVVVAVATTFFGGLQGEIASSFCISVLLIGIVVSGRAAVYLAAASVAWCGVVAALEWSGKLPPPIVAYNPIDAWTAVTVTLVLASVLLRAALESLEALHTREKQVAAERDEALRRSIQAQKMELVGTLTAGIAHDFNNLLTVITSAGSLLRDSATTDEHIEILDDLDAATSRATLMTRQLLAFGRAPTRERTVFDVGELITASSAMLARLLHSNITMRIDASEGCFVEASRAGIEQILLNLAVNARDAMPSGGQLTVTVRAEGDTVQLVATDSGVGMDEATQARIFEPFFTTKGHGTGLGLATVRDLVGSFGGSIRIQSEPGKGSTFLVSLPRRDAPSTAAAAPSLVKARAPGRARRALVVEDNPSVRRATSRMIEQFGFEVVAVADGDEALGFLGIAAGIACVVTDCEMVRMDGETLAKELAHRAPDLPVLLISGNRAPSPAVMAAPRRAFVEKPFQREQLFAALRGLLAS